MAGRQIKIEIIGDVASAKGAMSDLATHADGIGGRLKSAFAPLGQVFQELPGMGGPLGTLLGGLGQAAGELKQRFDDLDKSAGAIQKVGAAMSGTGVGLAGLGAGLDELATPLEQSQKQLETAIADTGQSFDTFKGKIGAADSQMQNFGTRNQETNQALATLTEGMHSPQEALQYLGETADIAAAQHISLSDAASLVVRLYGGSSRVLKQFGIDTASVTDAATKGTKAHVDFGKAMTELGDRTKGQAQAAIDSFGGHLDVLKTKVLDGVSSLGQKYGPALMGIGAAMTITGGALDAGASILKHFGDTAEIATGATEAMTGATEGMTVAEDAAAVSEGLALAPLILIVAGIAAVGVAAYELATHWAVVWDGIKAGAEAVWHFLDGIWQDIEGAVAAAWDWVKSHLGIIIPIVVGIVTGGIGVIPALIATHWKTVKHDVTVAWDDIVNFFTGIPGKIVAALSGLAGLLGHWISEAFNALVSAGTTAFTTVATFFTGIPGRILTAVGDAGKLLLQWGKDLITGLIDGIKSMAGMIGGAIKSTFDSIPGVSLLKKVPGLGWLETGGPAAAGQPYIVGEAGPELFIPDTGGIVVPNDVLSAAQSFGTAYSPDDLAMAALASSGGSSVPVTGATASPAATAPLGASTDATGSSVDAALAQLLSAEQAVKASVDAGTQAGNAALAGLLAAVKALTSQQHSDLSALQSALLSAFAKLADTDTVGFDRVTTAIGAAAGAELASLHTAMAAHK
jgi:phage-related protein